MVTMYHECQHGPLSSERDKGWLKGATPPHDALIKIVMDKRLLLSPLQVATNKDLHENLQMLTMHEWNVQYVMKFKK